MMKVPGRYFVPQRSFGLIGETMRSIGCPPRVSPNHDGTLFVMHAPFLSAVAMPTVTARWKSGSTCCPVSAYRPSRTLGGFTSPTAWSWAMTAGIALDEELNVFVRDNENDGGNYMIRVCHSFFGADHGYPYLYAERPTKPCRRWPTSACGSSAGGVCYLETQFPAEYRGNLFFCEWGRRWSAYQPERTGARFAPLKEIEFAAGAANDPYGFKPTDLVVQRDGSLIVADWADGQRRPRRGRDLPHRRHPASRNRLPQAVPPNRRRRGKSPGSIRRAIAERCRRPVRIERRRARGARRRARRRCRRRSAYGGDCTPSGSWPHLAAPTAGDAVDFASSIPTRVVRPRPFAPWPTWRPGPHAASPGCRTGRCRAGRRPAGLADGDATRGVVLEP